MRELLHPKNLGRERYIDVVKGVCILLVVLFHYQWSETIKKYFLFAFWFDMAVPVFMIVSGYVYSRMFERRGICRLSDAFELVFLLKRALRFIVPFTMYYAVHLIVICVLDPGGVGVLSAVAGYFEGGFGPGSFYFPVMLQFLILFPFVYFLVRKYGQSGFAACILITAALEMLKTLAGMDAETYRLLAFRYIAVIACGSLIAQKGFRPSPFFCLAAAVIGFAYTWLTGYAGIVLWSLEYWTSTSYAASFPVMALMMYAIPSVRLGCRPLEVLGKASFDIMLAQMLVYYSFAEGIYAAVSEPLLQIMICALLGVAGGLALYAAEFRITRRLVRCLR